MKKYILSILIIAIFIWITVDHISNINNIKYESFNVAKINTQKIDKREINACEIKEEKYEIFEATAYSYTGNKTATGTIPKEGRTVAVDPNVIPYGSKLIINGKEGYIAEDCGCRNNEMNNEGTYYKHVRGNRIDIYIENKQEALDFGRKEVKIEIIKES